VLSTAGRRKYSRPGAAHVARHSLTELLKIEHPIILAPMAGAMDAELAAEVSAAGGLGSLPCAMLTPDTMRDQIAKFRARTDKPVNVNFFCHEVPVRDNAREAHWRDRLEPYYQRARSRSLGPVPSSNRLPFDAASCEAIEDLKPEVVSFSFRAARRQSAGARQGDRLLYHRFGHHGSDLARAPGRRCRHRAGVLPARELTKKLAAEHRTNRDGLVRANDRALAHADVVGSRTMDLALALACGVRTHPIRTPFDRLIRAASMAAFDRALGPLGNLFGNTPSIRL
jgi:hypothetical protein